MEDKNIPKNYKKKWKQTVIQKYNSLLNWFGCFEANTLNGMLRKALYQFPKLEIFQWKFNFAAKDLYKTFFG